MRTPGVALLALLVVHATACISDRTVAATEPVAACDVPLDAIRRGDALVLIRGFTFMPDTVRVHAGRAVTWVNCEEETAEPHTATSGGAWTSPLLARGAYHTVTFSQSGVHDYLCSPHPFMRGVVIVE